jgi:hypothetical protein
MQTPAAPDADHLDALIGRAAHLALWLAGQVREMLAPLPGKVLEAPFLRHLLRHYLVPAEAALRRAVHLIAADMSAPRAPLRPLRPLRPPPRVIVPLEPVKRETVRPPTFRLTEPQPRPQTDFIPEHLRPRIRVLSPDAPLASPPPASQPRQRASLESRLRRRFAALDAALANPEREARRLLRLQARKTPRKPLLAFARIPGYRARPLQESGRSALSSINAELVARHLNTS